MFGHEKFRAYQCAIEFIASIAPIIEDLPRGNSHIIDQLRRASISIALNIAEGSGKYSPADRRRFYVTARASAMECAAILDVLLCLKQISPSRVQGPKAALSEIAGTLAKICFAARTRD